MRRSVLRDGCSPVLAGMYSRESRTTAPGIARADLHPCNTRPWSFADAVVICSPQTSFQAPDGLALSTLVIPLRVVGGIKPDDDVPSVQRHYSTFVPITDASAPVFRIGTLVLAVTDRLDFSLNIGTTGSCVPYRIPSQVHAAFMPDAGWAVGRLLPTLARGTEVKIPVSTSIGYVTTRHQRFTRVRLLEPHLTE